MLDRTINPAKVNVMPAQTERSAPIQAAMFPANGIQPIEPSENPKRIRLISAVDTLSTSRMESVRRIQEAMTKPSTRKHPNNSRRVLSYLAFSVLTFILWLQEALGLVG
ncbi:TPA: hypothetical protein LVL09_001084 [Klebsiella oxytoca]|nr:hypothetical protein [Citrobacter freundii]HBM2877340.1 hypothetical protein [Klebsiella oxytoca]HBU8667810.1 hypothetical protein [Klebsiella oxytoca]